MLYMKNVSTHYGKIQALHDVNLEVRRGEIVTLIGANGAGKTTLLMTLCGDPRATTGSIRYEGDELTGMTTAEVMRKDIAIVPEGRRVFSRLTVEENLSMGGFFSDKETRQVQLDRVLTLFPRLKERFAQRAGTMSGGEQQRVSIARALVTGPEAIFADEPTGELDTTTALSIGSILKDVVKESKATIIIATHDLTLAGICDSVIQIADGALGGSPDLRPSESR